MVSALAALGCAAGCAYLAAHHPLSAVLALALCAAAAAAAAWQPVWGLASLVALLPVLGLMPWTGWMTVEEFDLAVLAVAAGGYGRLALSPMAREPGAAREAPSDAGLTVLLFLLWGASVCVALARGVADSGGLEWGWWQGYHGPMNSLRLAKSTLLLLCLLPLWMALVRRTPRQLFAAWSAGAAAGAVVVGLLVVWERLAYTGLLNFSTDYRVTALFWEMHVGGAALDGYLALVMPFAVLALTRAHGRVRWALASAAVALGGYASLVTFSRGVYLAVPLGLLAMGLLAAMSGGGGRRRDDSSGAWMPWATVAALCTATVAGLVVMFPGSGYRGMLALVAAVLLSLHGLPRWRELKAAGWLTGSVGGVLMAAVLAAALFSAPKGPYLAFALAWLMTAGWFAWIGWRPGASASGAVVAWAGFVATALLVTQVALNWGGVTAGLQALPVAAGLIALTALAVRLPRAAWPHTWRAQGSMAAALGVAAVGVGVFMGGVYMEGRMAGTERDLEGRWQHWARAVSWLDRPGDLWLGRGSGRYPASHFYSGQQADQVGHWTWRASDGVLVLSAGKHTQGWGELFRVSQRIGAFSGGLTLRARVRSSEAAALHLEVCHKHLLYDDGSCRSTNRRLKAPDGEWQELEVAFKDFARDLGPWYAPRFIVLSVATASAGRVIEIDRLSAVDGRGVELLANGDFTQGMARWFSSSDRHHMPWHAKSLFVHWLFEQGALGLAMGLVLSAAALWRVSLGRARAHPLAPALAGAMLGVGAVGLFDSLVDAPRLALAIQWLGLAALTLPAARASPGDTALRTPGERAGRGTVAVHRGA